MARRDALLRLHKSLLARRNELLNRLGGELDELSGPNNGEGDSADQAFGTGNDEIASQLAEIDSKELNQINRALSKLEQGAYGTCEICGKKIPVARLNALPFSTTCVQCQREIELHGEPESRLHDDWEKVSDHDKEDREVNLSDIEMDMSNPR